MSAHAIKHGLGDTNQHDQCTVAQLNALLSDGPIGGGGSNIATGSYTGDDTEGRGITGIGIQPKYLKIWERKTTSGVGLKIWETSDVIVDDNANGMSIFEDNASDPTSRQDCIVSLDSDGFTIDKGGVLAKGPNVGSTVYNWMAIG